MSVVTFQVDVFPYCKGDVVELSADEKARVDDIVKRRNIEGKAYVGGDKRDETVDTANEARLANAAASRTAAERNQLDQAAQLEAQRNAVAEPANVDALGLQPESPASVVTGTEPVADVEVANPQEAVDISKPKGAQVKGSKAKK